MTDHMPADNQPATILSDGGEEKLLEAWPYLLDIAMGYPRVRANLLAQLGAPRPAIAGIVGVSESTAYRYLRLGLPRRG